ncbi:hypothetical protein LPJ59_001517 [Coemansia sp. RSA 2399]|nr:hypothetical protein LPJ59_001517 [Coemansia sp. RSA 2399]
MQKAQKNDGTATEKPVKRLFDPATGTHKSIEAHGRRTSTTKQQSQPKPTDAAAVEIASTRGSRPLQDGRLRSPKPTAERSSDKRTGGGEARNQRRSRDRQRRKDSEKQTTIVVPRILMRPERAAAALADDSSKAAATEQRPTIASTVSAEQAIIRTPQAQPQVLAAKSPLPGSVDRKLKDTMAYKRATVHLRETRLPLISPTGKFLDTGARKTLSHLRSRKCISVLGRAGTGKSMLMSLLAQPPYGAANAVFPLADPPGSVCTLGVDLWVTSSRAVLLDTPPVLDLHSSDSWPRNRGLDSGTSSRLVISKTHDLQMASLVLQTCDTLIVLVSERKRRGKGPLSLYDLYMDRGLAKLLASAVTLSQAILGLSRPAEPQSEMLADAGPGSTHGQQHRAADRRCKLHVVINQGPASFGCQRLDLDPEAVREIAEAYESETGIAVSGVSFLPTHRLPEEADDVQFMDIASAWGAQQSDTTSAHASVLPLYAPADRHRNKKAVGTDRGTDSLVMSPWEQQQKQRQKRTYLTGNSFDASVDNLRMDLLGAQSISERRSDPEGSWLTGCLRAWDSIRRSDALHSAAAMREDDTVDIVDAVRRAPAVAVVASAPAMGKRPALRKGHS